MVKIKNIKFTDEFREKLIIRGCVFVLALEGAVLIPLTATAYAISKNSAEIVDESQDTLDEDSDRLINEKSQTFNISDLVVIKNTKENQVTDFNILHAIDDSGLYHEYHYDFKENMQENTETMGDSYIYFGVYQPLYTYLTEEEFEMIIMNNGEITVSELDKILDRIRADYEKLSSKSGNALRLNTN